MQFYLFFSPNIVLISVSFQLSFVLQTFCYVLMNFSSIDCRLGHISICVCVLIRVFGISHSIYSFYEYLYMWWYGGTYYVWLDNSAQYEDNKDTIKITRILWSGNRSTKRSLGFNVRNKPFSWEYFIVYSQPKSICGPFFYAQQS